MRFKIVLSKTNASIKITDVKYNLDTHKEKQPRSCFGEDPRARAPGALMHLLLLRLGNELFNEFSA